MSEHHLSSFTFSALALGSLSADARSSAETHLASCERCRAQAAEGQSERDRFAQSVFARTLPQVQARAAVRWWSPATWKLGAAAWLVPAGALGVALAAVVLVNVRPAGPDLAIKGGPTLQVFAKRGIEVFAVHEGAKLQAGDQLRFAVEPGDFGHLLIASLDGAGHATIYYPFGGDQSGTVTPDSRSELPGSVTLDSTAGDERLFALFSKEPIASSRVLASLGTQANVGSIPFGAIVQMLAFHKEATP